VLLVDFAYSAADAASPLVETSYSMPESLRPNNTGSKLNEMNNDTQFMLMFKNKKEQKKDNHKNPTCNHPVSESINISYKVLAGLA